MATLWKKISRAAGHKKGKSSQPSSSQKQTQKPKPKQTQKLQSSPRPRSSSTQQTPSKAKASAKNQKEASAASDRTVVRHRNSSANEKANTDNKSKNRTSATAMSMMTPDMLETLGLTEFGVDKNQSRHGSQKQGHTNNSTAIASEPSRRSRDGTRTSTRERQQQQNSKKTSDDTTTSSSCLYHFADDDDTITKASSSATSSSSSSSGSSSEEPIPRDPFCDPSQSNCLWNLFAEDDEDDVENNASCTQQLYRDSANCDPMTCVSMVLAMPVACGMVCIDNVLDTTLFDTATQKYHLTPTSSSKLDTTVANDKYKDAKRSSRKKRWKSQLRRENRVSQ